ncbi:response regulator [Chelativorans sp. YIM 93263]|uniref:response regulator n=1 Tax=Chelativorans sp. YIM 93263 TaxID=2906648 RepID=UPI002379F55B|nr:response regulator [Chelativorans sp. YIM 93263]
MAKLLIVEDDLSVRSFTARALAAAGHAVETAEDGLEGLEKIKEAEGGYDLVLSDIRMPAMDGIDMAREAASAYPALRLLLMTGFADQRERAAEMEGTVSGVVNKPFTLAEIRQRIGEVLAA